MLEKTLHFKILFYKNRKAKGTFIKILKGHKPIIQAIKISY